MKNEKLKRSLNLSDHVIEISDEVIELRRDFHRHPELGFEEFRTSRIVSEKLTEFGIPHKTGIAITGVVGMIDSGKPGKTLLIRFDMDALPIDDKKTIDYASQTPGVMHA